MITGRIILIHQKARSLMCHPAMACLPQKLQVNGVRSPEGCRFRKLLPWEFRKLLPCPEPRSRGAAA